MGAIVAGTPVRVTPEPDWPSPYAAAPWEGWVRGTTDRGHHAIVAVVDPLSSGLDPHATHVVPTRWLCPLGPVGGGGAGGDQ